jgi:hypothetical protein
MTMHAKIITGVQIVVALGILAGVGFIGYQKISSYSSLPAVLGTPARDCSILNADPVEKVHCLEHNQTSPETARYLAFVALSDQEKIKFNCATFKDPIIATECEGDIRHAQMILELTKGNVGYCDTAFTTALYGDKAMQFQNDCKITYALDFSPTRKCIALISGGRALVNSCIAVAKARGPAPNATSTPATTFDVEVLKNAIATENIGLCGTDTTCKDAYYSQVAAKKADITLCADIQKSGLRYTCEYSVSLALAVMHTDSSYCLNIEPLAMQTMCKQELASGKFN